MTVRDQDALNFAQRLDDLDYYGLLGVERSARSLEIRSAFHALRRAFHPDNYLRADEKIRDAGPEEPTLQNRAQMHAERELRAPAAHPGSPEQGQGLFGVVAKLRDELARDPGRLGQQTIVPPVGRTRLHEHRPLRRRRSLC